MTGAGTGRIAALSPIKLAVAARRLRAEGADGELLEREPLAIVGLACRFPGAPTPEAFWELLAAGRDAVGPIPPDRWDSDALFDPEPDVPGRTPCRAAAFLDDVRSFDSGFFHISAREAALLDPQQRLLLEVAWEALERAGLAGGPGSETRTGVFVGISSTDYAHRQIGRGSASVLDAYFGSGSAPSFAAGRLSYFLGVRGPSLVVDTACSSALVALHLACASLRARECELALAGGVHLMLSEGPHLYLSRLGTLAPDGRSKAFDSSADGFGRGEGCGVVALKRLSDALAAGDQVLALVRGSAINQDGASGGLTVPNGGSQQAVIREALARAGIAPAAVDYLEAHGTGTQLGDPIELGALGAVFAGRPADAPLEVGSVKANVGHLEAAAGMAGLIKVVLAMQHGELPPQPHLREPSRHVPWGQLPLTVPGDLRPWPAVDGSSRIAGVSAFGLAGTNAHVVLEAPPRLPSPDSAQAPWQLLPISARSEHALRTLAERYADVLGAETADAALADVCFTAGAGRTHHRHRAAVTGRSRQELRDGLRRVSGQVAPHEPPRIAFVFTGQGARLAGAGRLLHASHPVFRDALDRCADILAPHVDDPVRPLLDGHAELEDTARVQPLLCALEWSLAELWRSWGIVPDVVLGHSVGEYAAACVGGMLAIEELLPLVARRGAAMQALAPEGAMIAVRCAPNLLRERVAQAPDELAVAAVNGPDAVVVSGERGAVGALARDLEAEGFDVRPLPVSHAFHSPLIEPALGGLSDALAGTRLTALKVPLASNLTGEVLDAGTTVGPDHWLRHAREPVRFADAMRRLYEAGHRVFVELGPDAVLCALGRQCLPDDTLWLPSLRSGRDDWETMLQGLGALYTAGARVDWRGLHRPFDARSALLPTYPFERRPFWLDEPDPAATPELPGPAVASTSPVPPRQSVPAAPVAPPPAAGDASGRRERLLGELTAAVASALGESAAAIDSRTPFVELGADSVMLAEAIRVIEERYGVRLPLRRLFEDLGNLEALSAHLARQPPVKAPASTPEVIAPVQGPLEPRRPLPAQDTAEAAAVRRHATELAARYNPRTARSKRLVAEHRGVLADSRAAAGFRPSTKELLYPIVGDRSEGAYLWDVDGNRYVDISMDFGVNLFGHRPPFLQDALREQLDRGLELAPRPRLAGEVAARLCELTGMERAVFCQSGSEAVMMALRLARLATGRSRVALFRNAYHGHTDGLLATVVETAGGDRRTVAAAPGIPANVADNLLVLDYGEELSLAALREHAGELAAVLVEPVQSRRPELQPRAFILELRRLTGEHGIPLVFDEMLTGFRPCLGGAQEFFGVHADLATYGKVIGGGLPLAAVAGRRDLLDGIDGGAWVYGDDSHPESDTTFFAGTFNCHPLAMAAARAVLGELSRRAPQLQRDLNARVERLAGTLNPWFEERAVPLRLVHFGSMFRFSGGRHLDLLSFHLLEEGVFVWEGRNCFLSAAHTDADVDRVADAVQRSVEEMRRAGCFGGRSAPPAADGDILPLSDAQRQLWLLSALDDRAALAYVEPVAVELEGPLDASILEAALQTTVARHEALRSTIEPDGEHQRVHRTMRLVLERVDLRGGDPDQREQRRGDWLDGFVGRPFDLAGGPLIRAGLAQLGEEHALLALAVHHVVADGWSLGIVLRDLASAYCAIAERRAPAGPAPIQFRDHLAAAAKRDGGPEAAAHESYWLDVLADAPRPVSPTSDRPRPGTRSWRAGREHRRVDADVRKRLGDIGGKRGASLFMTLLASYLGFLHRITGENDLVVGFPVLGRGGGQDRELVGYCTHVVPIRSRFRHEEPFTALLDHVRGAVLAAFDHQDLPFARLVRALGAEWRDGRLPLVGAAFNFDRPVSAPGFPGVRGRIVPTPAAAAKLELLLNVVDTGGGLLLDLEYDADVLEPEEARELADRYSGWLERLAGEPRSPLGSLPVGGERERATLLGDWSAAAAAYPADTCVHELIREQAARTPDAPALASPAGECLRYAELQVRADGVAARLAALGVGPDDRVAICVSRSPAAIVAQLGVLAAGAAYVPLAAGNPPDRLALMVADSGARLLVADAATRATCAEIAGAPQILDVAELWAAPDPDGAIRQVVPANLAYVVYTSGTTGTPKGVGITHANLCQLVRWGRSALALGRGHRLLQQFAQGFDGAQWETLVTLASGACLVVPGEDDVRDPQRVGRLLQDERITDLHGTPSQHEQLLAALDGPPPLLRGLHLGGEQFTADLYERLRGALGPVRFTNLYGPSEASVIAAWYDSASDGAPAGAAVPIGRPAANARLYVLDAAGEPVPRGTVGELYIGGPPVGRGYVGSPRLTAERFVPDPFGPDPGGRLYRTGDLVRHRRDGTLELVGRLDEQIKLRGFRLEPGEIESTLRRHPGVRDAAVIARAHGGRPALAAYVVPTRAADDALRPGVLEFVRRALPAHMVPASVTLLDALPVTANGKLDRAALPAPDRAALRSFTAPRTPAEATLTERFAHLLGVERVGVRDDFFALGGDSLAASQLVIWARREFSVELPLRSMFEGPTAEHMARAIAHAPPANATHAAGTEPRLERVPRETLRMKRAQLARMTKPHEGD